MTSKIPFRIKVPTRTCTEKHSGTDGYRRYKKPLRKDFNNRCGYCDIEDKWLGGKRIYHVDHFAPKKFSYLINDYSNLVYACPYCNIAKSDDWVSDNPKENICNDIGYVDPCSEEYDKLFYRDNEGNIIYSDIGVGKYMYTKLKLYAKRHSVIWNLQRLERLKKELQEQAPNFAKNEELKNKYIYISLKFDKYFEYLGDLINE